MKIINPSYEIMDRRGLTLEEKIEQFGRIAYKSEWKTAPGTAIPFCQKFMGHRSVQEGACLHLLVSATKATREVFLASQSDRFFTIEKHHTGDILISGTVRSFQEHLSLETRIGQDIASYLFAKWPVLFPDYTLFANERKFSVDSLDWKRCANLSLRSEDHTIMMVKFIVNRAVTHEIVRHRPCSFLQESQRYCRYDKEQFGNEVTFIKPCFFEKGSDLWHSWASIMNDIEYFYLTMLRQGATPQAARTVLPNSCKTEIFVYATLTEWKHIFKLRTSPAAEPSMREVMIPLSEEYLNKSHLFE